MHGFLGLPTRGGWLTILNATLWLLLALYVTRSSSPTPGTPLLLPSLLILSLPLTPFLVPNSHGPNNISDIVVLCSLLGLNSFLWGYGLSYLLTRFRRVRNSTRLTETFP